MKIEKQGAPIIRKKKLTQQMNVGETLNPNNLRYIDNQGMPYEEQAGGLWSSEVKAFMHAQTLKALFYSEDWVFITVDAIALPASFCPIQVFKSTRADDGKDKLELVKDHPVSKMFENPNVYQHGQELVYSYCVDFILGGNAFLYSPPDLNQLYNMPFERCAYDFDRDGMPRSITYYQTFQDDALPEQVGSKMIPLNDVIHARRPNPSSSFWGLSPFTPGRKSILTNRYTQDYILSFYLKGATPQMILEVETAASQKALVRMIRSFEAAYTGRRNQRRTMVLPKGVKATQADTKIVDQQFIDLVRNNRETILNILRVPKHALGLQESGSLGSREHEQALRWFWEQTVLPSMSMISSAIQTHFKKRKMLAQNEIIKFDTSGVSYTQDDLLKNADISNSLAQTWTVNERRKKIFGLPEIVEGDQVIGLQVIGPSFGLGQVATEPEVTKETESEPSKPIRIDLQDYRAKYARQVEDSEQGLSNALKNEAPKMKSLAVELFTEETGAALLAFKKATETRADFDQKKFRAEWQKMTNKLKKEYLKNYEENMQASVELGAANLLLNSVFQNEDKQAIEVQIDRDKKGRRQQLVDRGLFQFESTTDRNFEIVNKLIELGLKQGKTNTQISDDILSKMRDQARWRSNMIARTETLTAVSIGQAATMKAAEEILPGLEKIWISAQDDRVRDTHMDLNGQRVPAKAKFRSTSGALIDYPRAPGIPADEAINCRCTLLMVDPRDL